MSNLSLYGGVGQPLHSRKRSGRNAFSGHLDEDFPSYTRNGRHIRCAVEWHKSPAYKLLRPGKGHSGTWIPAWLRQITCDPASRRLLAWILFLYDDKETRSAAVKRNRLLEVSPDSPPEILHRKQHCRARAMRYIALDVVDGDGDECVRETRIRCVEKPMAILAAESGISLNTCRRVLGELVAAGVLIREDRPGDRGVLFYPNGHHLACAWLADQSEPESSWPEALVSLVTKWYESDFRRAAMNRDGREHYDWSQYDMDLYRKTGKVRGRSIRKPVARGTWLDDLWYAACEERPGPAHVGQQMLWWFGTSQDCCGDDTGLPRAPIVAEGRRWLAMSVRQCSDRFGYGRGSVNDWLDWLVEKKKFFVRKSWKWKGWNSSEAGIDHYSPEPETIHRALLSSRNRAKELRAARFAASTKSRLEAQQQPIDRTFEEQVQTVDHDFEEQLQAHCLSRGIGGYFDKSGIWIVGG